MNSATQPKTRTDIRLQLADELISNILPFWMNQVVDKVKWWLLWGGFQ